MCTRDPAVCCLYACSTCGTRLDPTLVESEGDDLGLCPACCATHLHELISFLYDQWRRDPTTAVAAHPDVWPLIIQHLATRN
jgi:hypothetical protein